MAPVVAQAKVIYFSQCDAGLWEWGAKVARSNVEGSFRAEVMIEGDDAYFVMNVCRRKARFWYVRDENFAYAFVQKKDVSRVEYDSHVDVHDRPIPAHPITASDNLPLVTVHLPEDSS